ncbi:MAG: prolipoprotein diacylglyceryl transferase family protein [Gemmatimonadaceae bacterium]
MTLGYLPYFEQPSVSLGPLTVHAFGVIVAASVWIGLVIGKRRFERMALDAALGERLAWWVVIGGFLGAHLFAVLFYFPDQVTRDPLMLLRIWEDLSSFGGIVGGAFGLWLFLRYRAPRLDVRARWSYVDVAAYVFPISLMIGRVGCTLAHDHPGTVTSFPLAVSLRTARAQDYVERVYANAGRSAELPDAETLTRLGFHDLGWYEFVYLAVIVVPLMLALSKGSTAPVPGRMLMTFIVLYMPVRFLLDFLRVSDARYAGLTPAQWVAAAALAALPILVMHTRRLRHAPSER